MQESVVLTAELKDELSAPLEGVKKEFDTTTRTVEKANKSQAKSTQDAASIMDKALGKATGAQSDMTKALEKATGKHATAMHNQEQALFRVNVAQQRLDELRSNSNTKASTLTAAESRLEDAQFKQAKAVEDALAATRGLEDARADLADATKNLSEVETKAVAPQVADPAKRNAAMGTLAPAVGVVGGAMTAGFGVMLKTYADFDKAMAGVQAATHETTQNMRLLREEAIRVGADTAFSAGEAAQGIEELAKAGVATQDILKGGLAGALDLAAAGELGVGEAAEIAATAMTQFKLAGDQIPHLADLLAAGAGKAQGSVQDLGGALNQSGLVASAAGASIEETVGTLAAFASNGLIGSDAGTSLKTMLQRLQNPAKKAANEMEDLGINMYNAQGEFAGMEALAGQLAAGMGDMTQAERDASMAIIFGSDAVRAANVLYAQGAEGIADWTAQVNDAGYAAKTASIMQDNLAGDVEKLGGAFDTVFLQSGGSANDVLRILVQALEGAVDLIGKIPAPILGLIGVFTGLTGGTLLLVGAIGMMAPKIKDGVGALRDLTGTGTKADKAVRGVGKAAGFLTGAIAAWATVGPLIASVVSSGNTADAYKLSDALFKLGSGGKAAGTGMGDLDKLFTGKGNFFNGLDVKGIDEAFRIMGNPNVTDNIDNVISKIVSFGTRGSSNLEFAKKNFAELDTQIADMVTSGNADQAATAYEQLAQKAKDAGVPTEKLAEIFPEYAKALGTASSASADAAAATEVMDQALEETGVTLGAVIEDMEKFLELLFQSGMLTMSARDANAAFHEATRGTKDAIKSATDALQKDLESKGYNTEAAKKLATEQYNLGAALNKSKTDFDLTTSAGAILNSQFQNIAQSGMADVTASAKEGMGQDGLQKKIMATYDALVKDANQMGIVGTAAEDLARKVLGVPDDVKVNSWMSDQAKIMAEQTAEKVSGIDRNVKVTTNFVEIGAPPTPRDILNQSWGGPQNSGGGVYMAGGGVVPGYAPGVDDIPAVLSRGESVLVPELTQAIGPSNIMALNHAYSGGRPAGAGPARASLAGLATKKRVGSFDVSMSSAPPASGAGSRSFTFAPQITVQGDAQAQETAQDIEAQMRELFTEFLENLEKEAEAAY